MASETSTIGVSRALSFQYDAASNRTRITWPDAYFAAYDYDAMNRQPAWAPGFGKCVGVNLPTEIGETAGRAIVGTASAIADAATRSLIDGSDFGDNIIAALPSVIGQTIGEAIAGGLSGNGGTTGDGESLFDRIGDGLSAVGDFLGFDGNFGYQGPDGRNLSLAGLGDAFEDALGAREQAPVPGPVADTITALYGEGWSYGESAPGDARLIPAQAWGRRQDNRDTYEGERSQARGTGNRSMDFVEEVLRRVMGIDQVNPDPSAVDLALEWATGTGPEHRDLFRGQFVDGLRASDSIDRLRDELYDKYAGSPPDGGSVTDWGLGFDWEFFNPHTRLEEHFLGSYNAEVHVNNGLLIFIVTNESDLSSFFGAHPIQQVWSSAPVMPDRPRPGVGGTTTQRITWTEPVVPRPPGQ